MQVLACIFHCTFFIFLTYILVLRWCSGTGERLRRTTFSFENKNKCRFILYFAHFVVPLHRILKGIRNSDEGLVIKL